MAGKDTDRGQCQKLKDLVINMEETVVVETASSNANNKDVPTMHPLLLAAACSGDFKALTFLLNRDTTARSPDPSMTTLSQEFLHHLTGDIEEGVNTLKGVTTEGDTALHVVATHGDNQDFKKCANVIHAKAENLLFQQNKNGDTPLHCAARAGNPQMVSHLIDLAAGPDKSKKKFEKNVKVLLRMENGLKETALHDAIRIGDNSIVKLLLEHDSELARFPLKGSSPLYIAILLEKYDIAQTLYDMSEENMLSYSGPNGQNALHAAVLQDKAMTEKMLNWRKDLAEQADKDGRTPLHFAASLIFGLISSSPLVPVLQANRFQLYQPDSEGSYPIHIAASTGAKETVSYFIDQRPDIAGFRDSNGRTFLHVAVESNRSDIVVYACRTKSLVKILNLQDKHGNTAIHIAVQHGLMHNFSCLLRNTKVNLNIPNNMGQTPLDISQSKILGFSYLWNQENLIWYALMLCHAKHGNRRIGHSQEQYCSPPGQPDEVMESEKLTKATQTLAIGSVLITTVSFGATFGLPGGYKSDGNNNSSDNGTPTLAGRYIFDAFILANTIAFICSVLATLNLMYSGVPMVNLPFRQRHFNISSLLAISSVTSLCAAFALGMLLVLSPVAQLTAAAVCFMMMMAASLCLFTVTDPLNGAPVAKAVYLRMGNQTLLLIAGVLLCQTLLIFWPCVIIFGWAAISTKYGRK